MVAGPFQLQGADHGVGLLVPAVREDGLVAGSAVDPRPPVTPLARKQAFQQMRAGGQHRGTDGLLQHAQTRPGLHQAGRGLRQPPQLGGDDLLERLVEPPYLYLALVSRCPVLGMLPVSWSVRGTLHLPPCPR